MTETGEITPPARDQVFAALAKARLRFPDIPRRRLATVKFKDKEGKWQQYSYKYADLSDVFSAVDEPLSTNGLMVMQSVEGASIRTVIGHSSGQYIEGLFPIKPMKGQGLDNAQENQGAVQVAKRYALTAILGISTEETREGDYSARALPHPVTDNFETPDGVRMPKGAQWRQGMSPRELAVEAGRAIEDQLKAAKTDKGLSGAWDRNAEFIDKLAEKHDDLYQNIHDLFHSRLKALSDSGEKEEEAPE